MQINRLLSNAFLPSTIGKDAGVKGNGYVAGIGGRVLPKLALGKVIVHAEVQRRHSGEDDDAESADLREHEHVLQLSRHANIVAIKKS